MITHAVQLFNRHRSVRDHRGNVTERQHILVVRPESDPPRNNRPHAFTRRFFPPQNIDNFFSELKKIKEKLCANTASDYNIHGIRVHIFLITQNVSVHVKFHDIKI